MCDYQLHGLQVRGGGKGERPGVCACVCKEGAKREQKSVPVGDLEGGNSLLCGGQWVHCNPAVCNSCCVPRHRILLPYPFSLLPLTPSSMFNPICLPASP